MEYKMDSMPLVAVAGIMAVGVVVAVVAVHQAFFANQSLDVLTPGREAAIMHIVLRGAVKTAVLSAGVMIAGWRSLCAAWEQRLSWRCLQPLIKLAAAVLAASSVSRCVAIMCMRKSPQLLDPIAALGGWRGFQLLDMVLITGLILALLAFIYYMGRRVVNAKSLARRIALEAFAILVLGGLSATAFGQLIFGVLGERRGDVIDDDGGEELRQDDGFRLDVDEPWEMMG